MICEYDNSTSSAFGALSGSGIPLINDRFDPINNGLGLMHNKFLVIDGRGGAAGEHVGVDRILEPDARTGTNLDFQNSIEIQDQALANAYTLEFNEMWGARTRFPARRPRASGHASRTTPASLLDRRPSGRELLQPQRSRDVPHPLDHPGRPALAGLRAADDDALRSVGRPDRPPRRRGGGTRRSGQRQRHRLRVRHARRQRHRRATQERHVWPAPPQVPTGGRREPELGRGDSDRLPQLVGRRREPTTTRTP